MKKPLKTIKFIKKILKTFFISIFIILFFYNIINLHNKEDYTKFMGYKIFVVQSYQAQSTFKKDTILIAKTNNMKIDLNDLIVLKINGGTYFHRVIDIIGNERYITKSDDENKRDENICSNETIEGKIVFKFPWVGKILNFTRTKIFSIIALIILVFIFKYNKHLYKKMNRRRLKQKSEEYKN